jgi:hypothetical protein
MNFRSSFTTTPRFSLCHLLCAAALVGFGMYLGANGPRPSEAWAQVITTPQPQHMLSGGQLSVPILKDISATLQQIDKRLSHLEDVAKQIANKR